MDVIKKYLTETLGQNMFLADKNYLNICKYEDIKNEFIICIESNKIPENGMIVEGYSAQDISEFAPFMNFLGVYNFLVSLRDNPDNAKQIIVNGFMIK